MRMGRLEAQRAQVDLFRNQAVSANGIYIYSFIYLYIYIYYIDRHQLASVVFSLDADGPA